MSSPAIALEHVVDARSENHRQERLIAALDTPEIDSAIEVAWLIRDKAVRDRMLRILAAIYRSNATEGQSEMAAAGILDQATRAAHMQRLGTTRRVLTVRAAANLLRPLLRADRGQEAGARWALLRALEDCRGRMDPAYLIGCGMRKELGKEPFDQMLTRLAELDAVVPS